MNRLDLTGERGKDLRYCLWMIRRTVEEARERHLDLPAELLETLSTLEAYTNGEAELCDARVAVSNAHGAQQNWPNHGETWQVSQVSRFQVGLWRALHGLQDANLKSEVEGWLVYANTAMEELLMDAVNAALMRQWARSRANEKLTCRREAYIAERSERQSEPAQVSDDPVPTT